MNNKEAIKWLNKNRPCISMTCNKENADNINIATDMAIKALELLARLEGFKYVTTDVMLKEHEVAHFDIYKRGWNDAIQAVIDAGDMPVMNIIEAIKENEVKEAENENG